MAEFDLLELKSALEAGKIPVCEDNIGRLDGRLRLVAQQYRARKVGHKQDLNAQLTRLEETKDFLENLWSIEPLLYLFEAETAKIIDRLARAAKHGVDFVKKAKEERKVRGDDLETILFMDLRDLYVALTGKTGISEDGPLHRFAKTCTKLIDESIVLPQPQSLRKALKRRATAPPYLRLQYNIREKSASNLPGGRATNSK
jgi:hypothetical protein